MIMIMCAPRSLAGNFYSCYAIHVHSLMERFTVINAKVIAAIALI